jgi:dihydroorotase
VDKDVEFGLASNGISGLETALGAVLAMVDAGLVPLGRAIEALTTGPARVLGARWGDRPPPSLVEGAPADLVVLDRAATWRVEPDTLASRGTNTPLLGRDLSGVVLATIAGGRLAYGAAAD